MAKCEACAKMETGQRGAPGHDGLRFLDSRKENFGTGAIHYRRYVCSHCGTSWEYENDPKDKGAGWGEER